DRATCGHPTDERQTHLLADGVLELDATRGTRNEGYDSLAGQGPQMLFSCVGRSEAQFPRDFRPRGGHSSLGDESLYQAQNLCLARCQIGHFGYPAVHIYSYCDYIQIETLGKCPGAA